MQNKIKELNLFFEKLCSKDIIVAFSGGVDSTLVLKLALEASKKYQTKVYALTIQTSLHPMNELSESKKLAKDLGVTEHLVLTVNELTNSKILTNSIDRCYQCKKFIFTKALDFAQNLNIRTIVDGTNEDDMHLYRPGIKALNELGIISPLALTHTTKQEVRAVASHYGLSVASKPSAPCLATRFPYDTNISIDDLKKVGLAEEYLKKLGFNDLIVRIHGNIARIEVPIDAFSSVLEKREEIITILKNIGYTYVTLDLGGIKSGSMNIEILRK